MKIYLNQFQVSSDPHLNYRQISDTFEHHHNVDLIISPELFLSGFQYSRLKEASRESREALANIQKLCITYKTAFLGTFLWEYKKKFYNRAYFIDNQGEVITHYDKQNLIPSFKEDEFITPGHKQETFQYMGLQIGIAICYDLRFPELFRKYAKKETDLILIPAQWPVERKEHMITLAIARAIENQCYVALTNSNGTSGKLKMAGESMLINPKGEILVRATDKKGGREGEVHLAEVLKWRGEFPALYQYSRSVVKKFNRFILKIRQK